MAATSTTTALSWASASNQGPRKENQDRVLTPPVDRSADPRGVLLVLCDGVGGEEGGHIAAQVASQEAMRAYYAEPASDPASHLRLCIDKAWEAVRRESVASKFGRMASTIVLTAVHGDTLYVAHVGDSRAYVMRDGRVRQLTHDHTYVNAQIAAGVITPEEAKTSVYRSVLTRSLGANNDHTPDLSTETLRAGDRVLLCSDGLHGVADSAAIERVLAENADPERAAAALIDMALRNKTGDNVTVAVLNYGLPRTTQSARMTAAHAPTEIKKRPAALPLALIGVVVALAAVGAGLVLSGVLNPITSNPATAVPTLAVLQPGITETAPPANTAPSATRLSKDATALPTLRASATRKPGEPTATIMPTPTETATRRPTSTLPPTRTRAPEPTASPTLAVTVVPVSTAQPPAPAPQPEPPQPQPTSPPPAATEVPTQPPPTVEPGPPGVVTVTPRG